MNAFEVLGPLLALWALLVSFLGITREDFPGEAEKVVGTISAVLVVLAIGSAIYVGVTDKKEEDDPAKGGSAGLVLPL
jgi:hypothetical protein